MKKLGVYIWVVNLKWTLMMAKISQKIELRQQLSPRQILNASLLQLNLPLLEQRILHELEINPALEMIDLNKDHEVDMKIESDEQPEQEIEFEWEELLGVNDDYEYAKSFDKKNQDFETPIIANETFFESILKELHDFGMNSLDLQIAEEVLGNLDEQGYLNIEPSLISDRMQLNEQKVLKVIKIIQRLDPPGLAASSIQECLLIQAETRDENKIAISILKKYFDDFANHRYEKIIEGLNCSKSDLNDAMEFISRLNPSPRDDKVLVDPDIIVPDVTIEERLGKFYITVQDGNIPEIKVSKNYIKMLDMYKEKKDVNSFVKKKIESANWFIDAVKQRKNTIQRVVESIIKHQKNYFDSDERNLAPMVLKDVADDIGMDVSTISRVTNGKYVQLPWEIKELKTFFSEGVETLLGDSVSNTEIKNVIKKIIKDEDKRHPVSDKKIAEMLDQKGYKIARRTVAKYREQLKFPTARLRRKV